MLFDHEGPGGDYESLHVVQDQASGLRAIVCLHSTALGPATGGVRRMRYDSEADALADAARLAHGMSLKNAMAGLPAGGGKAVILDHDGLDRGAAYTALGRAIAQLDGRFRTGPDVGTTPEDLETMRAVCPYVNAPSNDAGVSTARGVLAGIRGTLAALDGARDVADKRFVVQGLGEVGHHVATELVKGGAKVSGCDPSAAARERAAAVGVDVVDLDAIWSIEADLFVPCALGGILTPERAAELPFRAVCGSANNQLTTPEAGTALHQRGVLYAPDFVVNAGAVIEGVIAFDEGASEAQRAKAASRIDAIEDTVRELLAASAADDVPPHDVAVAEAARRIAVGR